MRPAKAAMMAVGGTLLLAGTGAAEIRYTQSTNHQTTSLSGLTDDKACTVLPLAGKVVKRDFAKDGVNLSSFVIEKADGTRQLVNVWLDDDISMAAKSIVQDGLQRLLREGRDMRGQAAACGAGGRVLMLESLR